MDADAGATDEDDDDNDDDLVQPVSLTPMEPFVRSRNRLLIQKHHTYRIHNTFFVVMLFP